MNQFKYILILLAFKLSNCIDAQGFINEQDTTIYREYQSKSTNKIALELIIGKWISNDTLMHRIEFENEGLMVNLLPKTFLNPYSFLIENDSIRVAGSALNWPPYYCLLNMLNENVLEMKFFSFGSNQSISRHYVKEKAEK